MSTPSQWEIKGVFPCLPPYEGGIKGGHPKTEKPHPRRPVEHQTFAMLGCL